MISELPRWHPTAGAEGSASAAKLRADKLDDHNVFVNKRHGIYQLLSRDTFAKLLATAGERAGIDRRLRRTRCATPPAIIWPTAAV
jgi:hypothetical protein